MYTKKKDKKNIIRIRFKRTNNQQNNYFCTYYHPNQGWLFVPQKSPECPLFLHRLWKQQHSHWYLKSNWNNKMNEVKKNKWHKKNKYNTIEFSIKWNKIKWNMWKCYVNIEIVMMIVIRITLCLRDWSINQSINK